MNGMEVESSISNIYCFRYLIIIEDYWAGRLLEIKLDMMSILKIEPQKGCLIIMHKRSISV